MKRRRASRDENPARSRNDGAALSCNMLALLALTGSGPVKQASRERIACRYGVNLRQRTKPLGLLAGYYKASSVLLPPMSRSVCAWHAIDEKGAKHRRPRRHRARLRTWLSRFSVAGDRLADAAARPLRLAGYGRTATLYAGDAAVTPLQRISLFRSRARLASRSRQRPSARAISSQSSSRSLSIRTG